MNIELIRVNENFYYYPECWITNRKGICNPAFLILKVGSCLLFHLRYQSKLLKGTYINESLMFPYCIKY